MQLREYIAGTCFNSSLADDQLSGDLGVAQAARGARQHLALTIGQLIQRRLCTSDSSRISRAATVGCRVASPRRSDRPHQLLVADLFQQVRERAGLDRRKYPLILAIARQHNVIVESAMLPRISLNGSFSDRVNTAPSRR